MNRFLSRTVCGSLIVFAALVSGFNVYAQGVPVSLENLNLTLSKDNPSPGQTVTITAKSYSTDIDAAKVSWSVDGKVIQTGIGLTLMDVKAPSLGKRLNVIVVATDINGKQFNGQIIVSSGSVDMVVETDGYVPPFFAGKLSAVYQNEVKIAAIPHLADTSGKEYDPSSLVYQWKVNDQVIAGQSGYGKQSMTLVGNIVPRPYSVLVNVWTRDNSALTSGRVLIKAQSPTIAFYVNDPLYGPLFNRAISKISIGSQKEQNILAVPFGFNKPASGIGDLLYNWQINNVSHSELSSSESVILRVPDGAEGSSAVVLDIRNGNQIMQGSTAGFSAVFNSKTATN